METNRRLLYINIRRQAGFFTQIEVEIQGRKATVSQQSKRSIKINQGEF
jgi:hypothetical protein